MFSFFNADKKIAITDDSGFLAIVNTSLYNSFVDEDWELTELFNHFISEMNKDAIIVWATGAENEWTISFTENASSGISFREFTKTIRVTDEKLYLSNYEDLTTAAQFEDSKLPTKHNANLHIELNNGLYNVTVRQLFNPEDISYDPAGKTNFEIVMQTADDPGSKTDILYWQQA